MSEYIFELKVAARTALLAIGESTRSRLMARLLDIVEESVTELAAFAVRGREAEERVSRLQDELCSARREAADLRSEAMALRARLEAKPGRVGTKIEAIRQLRYYVADSGRSLGLKEAKDLVESLAGGYQVTYPGSDGDLQHIACPRRAGTTSAAC